MQRSTVAPFNWASVQAAIDRLTRQISSLLSNHNLLGGRSETNCHPPQAISFGMTTAERLALVCPEGTIVYDTQLNQSFIWDGAAWQAGGTDVPLRLTTAERIALNPPDGTLVYDTDLSRLFVWQFDIDWPVWSEV